jgi:hypothetical protein
LLPVILQDGLFCEALSPILRRTIPCLGISPMETITHPTLVQLVAAGAVRVVVAVGQPGGWTLLVRYGLAERALAAQRSKQLRVFRKLDTLQAYLQDIGVVRFEIDAAGFEVAPRRLLGS